MTDDRHERASAGLADPLGSLVRIVDDFRAILPVDLAASVPDCPGWTLRDLITHLGRVYGAVTTVLESRSTEPVKPGPESFLADDADDAQARTWFDERIRRVLTALADVPPETTVWTWSHERTAAFYRRRMVHETAVHLADLACALGREVTIDRDVCVDGVDEYFDVMLPRALGRADATRPSGSLHVHCTDGPGEWLVVLDRDRAIVTREHAKGAVAWRGPAMTLLLAVWGRPSPALDVVGDRTVSAEWSALAP